MRQSKSGSQAKRKKVSMAGATKRTRDELSRAELYRITGFLGADENGLAACDVAYQAMGADPRAILDGRRAFAEVPTSDLVVCVYDPSSVNHRNSMDHGFAVEGVPCIHIRPRAKSMHPLVRGRRAPDGMLWVAVHSADLEGEVVDLVQGAIVSIEGTVVGVSIAAHDFNTYDAAGAR